MEPTNPTTPAVVPQSTTGAKKDRAERISNFPVGTVQLTEAVLKETYRSCVQLAIKGYIGENADPETWLDELCDLLAEYYAYAQDKPDNYKNLEDMGITMAGFCLAMAASYRAHTQAKAGSGKPLHDAASQRMRALLGVPEANKILKEKEIIYIDGINYEVCRPNVYWDGDLFQAPYGSTGGKRYFTKREAVFSGLIMPTGKPVTPTQPATPVDDKVRVYGAFLHQGVAFELINSSVAWDSGKALVVKTFPNADGASSGTGGTLSYPLDQAITMGLVRVSPAEKRFIANGSEYQLLASDSHWDGSYVRTMRGFSEITWTIEGALAGGHIKRLGAAPPSGQAGIH